MELDFASIVADNQAMVYSLALRFLRNHATAEELAQDVFVQLHGQLRRVETPAHATAWLRRATAHRCIDEARKRRLRPRVGLESAAEPGVDHHLPDTFLNARLLRMVASLPDAARMIVLLRYQEDMEPAEIAQMLGVPLGTVKSRLHRSLAVLKAKLQKQEVRQEASQ